MCLNIYLLKNILEWWVLLKKRRDFTYVNEKQSRYLQIAPSSEPYRRPYSYSSPWPKTVRETDILNRKLTLYKWKKNTFKIIITKTQLCAQHKYVCRCSAKRYTVQREWSFLPFRSWRKSLKNSKSYRAYVSYINWYTRSRDSLAITISYKQMHSSQTQLDCWCLHICLSTSI